MSVKTLVAVLIAFVSLSFVHETALADTPPGITQPLQITPAIGNAGGTGHLAPGSVNFGRNGKIDTSVGTVAAAALETMGYKAQSQVLTDLEKMLNSLAALIFTGCVLSAIFTIAVGGQYRAALWLLIGPTLFYFVLYEKTTASGTLWQLGTYPTNASLKVTEVEAALGRSMENEQVSQFFHKYNKLISSIVTNLVRVLTDETPKAQLRFMTRQRLTDEFIRSRVRGDGINALTQYTFAQCSDMIDSARTVALGHRDMRFRGTPEYRTAEERYCKSLQENRSTMTEGPAKQYAKTLVGNFQANQAPNTDVGTRMVGMLKFDGYSQCKTRLNLNDPSALVLERPLSCEQLWCLMGLGVTKEMQDIFIKAGNKVLPKDIDDATMEGILKEIEAKLVDKPLYADSPGNPASQPTPLRCETATGSGTTPRDLSLIPVIVGGYLLRKELTSDPSNEMIRQVFENAGINREAYRFTLNSSPEQRQETVRRLNQHQLAEAAYAEVYVFAMMLPYLQGVILYILALTFPFFALLILVPGYASSFFTWLTLWAWVKLWDVGFAMVMIADNVLWNLMPHSSNISLLRDPGHGPASVFESAFYGDPAYSLATYYVMLAIMLNSIPVLMGQFILGSKKAVGGILIDGSKNLQNLLGKASADWAAVSDQISNTDRIREEFRSNYALNRVKRGETAQMQGFPEVGQELSGLKQQSEQLANEGAKYRGNALSYGAIAGGVGAVGTAAVAGLFTGGVGSIAVLAALGGGGVGVNAWFQTNKAGLKLQRLANSTRSQFVRQNAQVHFYNSWQQSEYRNIEEIRAGLTQRGEYFNVGDAPLGTLQTVLEARGQAEASREIIVNQHTREMLQTGISVPWGGLKK